MDEETQRWLMSNVDAHGNPKWEPPTFDELSKEEIEGLPEDDSAIEYEEVYEDDQYFLEDTWHIDPTVEPPEEEEVDSRSKWIGIGIVLGIFLLALLPRLYFLFFVSDPQNAGSGWYGDTYHHWQIAYFTKEIGLSQGFRLWDLKGMEYFWGPLHPLLLTALFALTGSTDIVLTRLLSIVFGSVSCIFVFYIGRKLWNTKVGVAAMLFAALNPVGIFNDASGMVEPIGIPFLLAGLYYWPRKGWLTGILWAIAGTLRAEYWLFSVGLVAAVILTTKEKTNKKIALSFGWIIPTLVYMKFLLDRTGNPIYPIYWSFIGNAAGRWQADVPFGPEQTIGRIAFIIVLIFSAAGILYTYIKKPSSYLLDLLGLGNLLFLGVFVGLTAYSLSYRHYFWVVRIFILPYMYLGLMIAALLFLKIPLKWKSFSRPWLGWVITTLILVTSQLVWIPIWRYYEPTNRTWQNEVVLAEEIAATYEGGTVLIPEGDPNLTYTLVQFQGFTAHNLLGQKYDPFAYFEGDPFSNWSDSREVVFEWLEREDIRLMVFYTGKDTYTELIRREPYFFRLVKQIANGSISIYEVMY